MFRISVNNEIELDADGKQLNVSPPRSASGSNRKAHLA